MLFNMDVFLHVLKLAKDHGATVSLDLASFEVVRIFRDKLDDIIRRYVDVVFANEDEARGGRSAGILRNRCRQARQTRSLPQERERNCNRQFGTCDRD